MKQTTLLLLLSFLCFRPVAAEPMVAPAALERATTPTALLLPVQNAEPLPEMEALLAPYAEPVAALQAPIAECTVETTKRQTGEWMAACILKDAAKRFAGTQAPERTFAFVNMGGVRSQLPRGAVSRATMLEIMPFPNTITYKELSAEQVRQLAREFARREGYFPMAGAKMDFSVGPEQEGGALERFLIHGKPVEDGVTYLVGMPNYLAEGGDRLNFFGEWPVFLETHKMLRDEMTAQALALNGEALSPPPAGSYRRLNRGKENAQWEVLE